MNRNYRLFRLTIQGKPFLAKVEQDEFVSSPLEDFGTDAPVLACWHRRYNLGTEEGHALVKEQVRESVKYRDAWEETTLETPNGGYYENKNYLDFDSPKDLNNAAHNCGFLVLPLFLYDHSGITMNTTGFSCRWDSGQVGFIAWSKKARQAWNGESWKHDSKQRKEKDLETMRSIVRQYDQFLTGDVYCITLLDMDGTELETLGEVYGHEYAAGQAFYNNLGADTNSVEEIQEPLENALVA